MAQGLRHAERGGAVSERFLVTIPSRRREEAFGSRRESRAEDDEPREENEPQPASWREDRGREGAAWEGAEPGMGREAPGGSGCLRLRRALFWLPMEEDLQWLE